MGWASYIEDITDRLTDDLARIRSVIGERVDVAPEVWVEVRTILAKAENSVRDLINHLDLATDPDVELSAYSINLERKIRTLEQDLAIERRSTTELRLKLDRLEEKLNVSKVELKASKKAHRALQDKLENAFDVDAKSIYDAFSTADQIKRGKPNA
jgi:SMC interacting uncharacterized protein involved in chromosome segregation